MSRRLIIAGAGGFGRGVLGWLRSSPRFKMENDISSIAFIDDGMPRFEIDAPIVSKISEFVPRRNDLVLCAVGNPEIRKKIVAKLQKQKVNFGSFVDDRAVIGPNVQIGVGSIVCPGTVISADARLEDHVHVNFNCSVGHDTVVGEFSTLSPSVNLMGEVVIGNEVFFGGSAAVLPRLRIGSASTIGALTLITKDIPSGVTVKGVPGKWT